MRSFLICSAGRCFCLFSSVFFPSAPSAVFLLLPFILPLPVLSPFFTPRNFLFLRLRWFPSVCISCFPHPSPHRKPQLSQCENAAAVLLFPCARCTIEAGKRCANRIIARAVLRSAIEGKCPQAHAAKRRGGRPRAVKGKMPAGTRREMARPSAAGRENGREIWNKMRFPAPCLRGGSSGG